MTAVSLQARNLVTIVTVLPRRYGHGKRMYNIFAPVNHLNEQAV
jgi:hypothetical protein